MSKASERPRIDLRRIKRFADLIETLPRPRPLNFYSFLGHNGLEIVASDMYPPQNAPGTIDFFFFACIHQYGFWHGKERYEEPLYGVLDGKKVKGSDLLWKLLLRAQKNDAGIFTPERLATMWLSEYCRIFSDDNGPIPLFISDERYDLSRAYGAWFAESRLSGCRTPAELVLFAKEHPKPLATLRTILTHERDGIPGYREDPLHKKALLLLMALANRPERFIIPEDDFAWDPIIDYHLMRLDLRMGHVILPRAWRTENAERHFTAAERERAIREADYRANQALLELLKPRGITMSEIDVIKWMARKFCPETEVPNCGACTFRSVCAQNTERFQPVIRTTAY